MTTDSTQTQGINLQTRRRWLGDLVELLSSMRFAIASLTIIAIASVIGTVMKQNEPTPNYINQFGEFWFAVFDALSLYTVYTSGWFLAVLFLLVVSTTLCIIRNAPKMIKDALAWREQIREGSLRAFGHKTEGQSPLGVPELAQRMGNWLQAQGYKVKATPREVDGEAHILLAAKRGASNRLGYIFAHGAIVLMSIGYLFDTDLPVKIQVALFGKQPISGAERISDGPSTGRLSPSNPSFRGNSLIPEGQSSDVTVLNLRDGLLIQDLPFTLTLKKFRVEYYSTGMPKVFASDVELTDKIDGSKIERTIEVNKPLIHRGIAIYQANFDDGGSSLELRGHPMRGAGHGTFSVKGVVGENVPLKSNSGDEYSIEFTGFRPINVETINEADPAESAEGKPEQTGKTGSFSSNLDAHLGSAAKNANNKNLRNIGPSIQYKLRDRSGQAVEYHNYMLPVLMEGASVYLAGVKRNPNEPFRYLRIPAYPANGIEEFMRLRAALANRELREQAAQRFAQQAVKNGGMQNVNRAQLQQSAENLLHTFAGHNAKVNNLGGLQGVAELIEKTMPKDEQPRMVGVLLKILESSLWELWQVARVQDKLPLAQADASNGNYLRRALNALSDSLLYDGPVYLQLTSFQHVQASGFQMTRSPGKPLVYLGCLFLVLGVFAMFYVRERRIWILVKPAATSVSQALLAFSSARRGLDFEDEFKRLQTQFAAQL